MTNKQLSRLERVRLCDVWENEALNFTPWLAGLQTLGIDGTKVTDAGVAQLKKALPNCRGRK